MSPDLNFRAWYYCQVAWWELNAVPRSGDTDSPGALALHRTISTRKGDPQSTDGERAAGPTA